MTAAISGGLGDIVYSLQLCKYLGVTKLYIKDIALEECKSTFAVIAPLVQVNYITPHPVITDLPPMKWPGKISFDYDLDKSRRMLRRDRNHILTSFMTAFKQRYDIKLPWLYPFGNNSDYVTVMVTQRWRDNSSVNWAGVLKRIRERHPNKPILFLGWSKDYEAFCNEIGNEKKHIMHVWTRTALDVQKVVGNSVHHYCNQNFSLAIVQGNGNIPYSCEFKPGKTNCRLYTPYETAL